MDGASLSLPRLEICVSEIVHGFSYLRIIFWRIAAMKPQRSIAHGQGIRVTPKLRVCHAKIVDGRAQMFMVLWHVASKHRLFKNFDSLVQPPMCDVGCSEVSHGCGKSRMVFWEYTRRFGIQQYLLNRELTGFDQAV